MNPIKIPVLRDIDPDFVQEIIARRTVSRPPRKAVIFFRDEHLKGIERDVYEVPIELLRYRKDNGRISSDVASYEKNIGHLKESSIETQKTLASFLDRKDPELTEVLMNSIKHTGQNYPAIVTCDGFLINGNRRKLALEKLKLTTMKVVILPGKGEEGGPPTLLEIEQIENRYQLQSEGKAEYYSFDRALSIRRKEMLGMTLDMQLRDDPQYINLPPKEFEKVMQRYREDFLEPLKCIDQYLESLGREGLYDSISTGISDREGRWQAFLDYYKSVGKKLNDDHRIYDLGISENEVGIVRDIAFKIIRKREFKELPKVHEIMRKLPQMLINPEAKEALFQLKKIKTNLPKEDLTDDGKEINERKKDQIWASRNATELQRAVAKALNLISYKQEKEKPLDLLKAAYQKITHRDLIPSAIEKTDYQQARKIALEIEIIANKLAKEFFDLDKLSKRFSVKNEKKKKYK
jgi:hypothetical protein